MSGAQGLATRRCRHHPLREAAVCCPECRRFYCRECVSEHGERLLCAGCLGKLSAAGALSSRRHLAGAGQAVRLSFAVLLAWAYFYGLGRLLQLTPDATHATTRTEKAP